MLVVVVLVFFLYDVRSGLIVATTIPLSLLFAFICLDLRHIPANLLSIGAIDFGILVDAAVVMVENIHRQLATAARDDRTPCAMSLPARRPRSTGPIVYAVAVIVTGFLPIYVLSGPSGRLFTPMADTMIYALIGSLLLTLTAIPLLCLVRPPQRRPRPAQSDLRMDPRALSPRAAVVSRASAAHGRRIGRHPRS